ncbi:LysR family transcriptional regulator [Xenophilus sp. AP218F]|nr:LysR family transcriptional regulator [Xenophilus sp. AP218F]
MQLNNRVRKLDFQDLLIFERIHQLRSVTAAAAELDLSQSSVSYGLKRLRDALGDALFVPTSQGMTPTHRADLLHPRIQQMLQTMAACQQEAALFDPQTQDAAFTVYAPEYFEILILPALLARLQAAGARATLRIRKPEQALPHRQLADGEIDLALLFGPDPSRPASGLLSQTLLADRLLIVEAGVADCEEAMPLEQFLARRHVFPTPWHGARNLVDGWLAAQGLSRQIAAHTNSYYSAMSLLPDSPLLLMLPERLLPRLRRPGIAARPAPAGLPGFSLEMAWSARRQEQAANRWLRRQLIETCASLER